MRYFFLVLVMFTAMMFWNLVGSQDGQHILLNTQQDSVLQQPIAIETATPSMEESQSTVQEWEDVALPENALGENQGNNLNPGQALQQSFPDNTLEALLDEQGWNMADVDAILDSFSEEDRAEVRQTLAEVLSN